MIETLISSKTRIKLLIKFFLNSSTTAYLRNLEQEFGESTNAIRVELNRLEGAGMLSSFQQGNKKMFRVNPAHPLFQEIQSIVRKYVGLDQIVSGIVERLGAVERVYLTGAFAQGLDSGQIELILIGQVDQAYLDQLVEKAQAMVRRRISYEVYTPERFGARISGPGQPEPLLLWQRD
ncbi:MAG: ArsR family transcriptional regulator [Bacteroidia bacterium]|nr:ArsR family transcriptional regulator [Bacteroidia bacterium]